MKSKLSVFWVLTLSLAAFTLLMHLFTCTNYELHRDELLYMALGQHLSFGYMSTPPLMGLWGFGIQRLFGQSEIAVKLLPVLCGCASVIVTALMVRQLGGKNFAVFAGCAAFILSPAFLRSDNMLMPVPFDEFYWALLAYLVLKLINTGNEKLWLPIGLLTGFAFLNKYSIIFFAVAMIVALLVSRHRKLLWSRYLVYAVIIAFAVVSPNLYWQFQHKFPVITHMVELRRTQLVNETPVTFIAGQLLMNLPCVLIWLTGLLCLLFFKAERRFQFIALSYVFVSVLLILGKGKAYYSLGAYPMLFAAGGYVMEKYFTLKLVWLRYVYLAVAIAVSGFILPLAIPVLPVEKMEGYCKFASRYIGDWPMRWEDGKIYKIPQDYADMTGWKQLAGLVATAYLNLDTASQNHSMIFTQDYGQAGAILYYDKPIDLPEPVCLVDAFLFWAPDSVNNTTLICVDRSDYMLNELFYDCKDAGTVRNKYFRENGLNVYVCHNPKPGWQGYYRYRVKQLKNEFNAGI